MAFQQPKKQPQFADLIGILAQSRGVDNALYQTVQEIINRLDQFAVGGATGERGAIGPPGPTPSLTETFVTSNTEPTLVNHRRLTAGTNVTLDTTTPGQIVVNATGSGSGGGPHAPTHQPGGSDPMQVDAIPTIGSLRTLGSGPNQAAPGNDIRFTDARIPLPHAPTHSQGSTDPVDVKNLAGYPGGTTQFLRADHTFAAPPAGSGGGMEYLGDYVTPHTYNDGDIVIGSDGIAYVCTVNGTTTPPEPWPGGGMAVNVSLDATYWTATPHSALTNEYALNSLANGYVKSTGGVPSTVAGIPPGDLPPFIAYTNINNPWTAPQTFVPPISITGANATLFFNETAAPVNLKLWRHASFSDGNYYFDALSDAVGIIARYIFGRDGILIAPAFQGDGSRWTNIIPVGTIVLRQDACPPGWTRVAWDGQFLRVGATFSTAGGSNPTTHSHGAGSYSAGSHNHLAGTLVVDAHNHGSVSVTISGTTGNAGSHDHTFSGTTGGESNGQMNVDAGASGNMTRAPHTHGFSGTTANEPNHAHSFSGSGSGGTGNAAPGLTGNTGSTSGISVSGTSAVVSHLPPHYDVILCMKN
jgi:hypothetical protein